MDIWKEDQLNLLFDLRSPETLFDTSTALAKTLGFDHCAYGMRTPLPFSQQRIVMFNDYPGAWQARYQEKGYLMTDPSVHHGLASLETYVWPSEALPGAHAEFWADAHAHGLRSGISIPVLTPNGIRGMFTVTRSERDSDPEAAFKLRWLSAVVHQALSRSIVRESLPEEPPSLTDRETEVLKWIADGKTSGEIAATIGITERTVNFHINSAVAKLGASNRTAAVVRAIVLGLIT